MTKTENRGAVGQVRPKRTVAVLFARADSIYKKLNGTDVWDEARDARRYVGNDPVIAHPPCRGYGRLKHFAKATPSELALAPFAVDLVRRNGGVLEHPAGSSLWGLKGLPRPVEGKDEFGGYTVLVDQCHFGHRAQKATWLYICGIEPADLPPAPLTLGFPDRLCTELGRAAREHTPVRLARWLVEVAKCIDRAEPSGPAQLAKSSQVAVGQLDRAGQLDPVGQLDLDL